jgi:hypothetical protein
MGVTGHWIDANFKMKSIVFAFEEMKSSHSGVKQAETLLKVLIELGVLHKLLNITVDNASSNDKLVNILAYVFNKWQRSSQFKSLTPKSHCFLFFNIFTDIIS